MQTPRDYEEDIQDLIDYIREEADWDGDTFEEAAAAVIERVWSDPRMHSNVGGALFEFALAEESGGSHVRVKPSDYLNAELLPDGKTPPENMEETTVSLPVSCGCMTQLRDKYARGRYVTAGVIDWLGSDESDEHIGLIPLPAFTKDLLEDSRIPADMRDVLMTVDEDEMTNYREMSEDEVRQLLAVFAEYQTRFDEEADRVIRTHPRFIEVRM